MKKTLLLMLMGWASLGVMAQDDVTRYYLTNYGFDTDFDYPATSKVRVAQEIRDIEGWTANLSANYTITGVYEFGFGGTFNGTSVPAKGRDGEAGGALALSTGWEQTFCYSQSVTLPAGTYTFSAATYNAKGVTGGTSLLAWIPNSGTSVTSTLSRFPSRTWTEDKITFTLTRSTAGKLQIGYKAAGGASSNSANLLIDYVKLTGENMTVSKVALRTSINTANRQYGEGTGKGAADLKAAIDAAQTVYDNADATMPQVLEANYNVKEATETYKLKNATESSPVVMTSRIKNPSFETNGTAGWEVSHMGTQSNSVFSKKSGTYYLETWTAIGQTISEASVMQTLKNLPKGNYKLQANALHIQQSSSGSTVNRGEPQTGAYLFAGTAEQEVTAMQTYELRFAVIDEGERINIGLHTDNSTGNWLCVDYFRLQYIGELTAESYAQEVQNLSVKGQALLDKGIQDTAGNALKTALASAQTALAGTGTDGEGKTLYDQTALAEARTALLTAIEAAEASRVLYDNLQARIDYAQIVAGWWEGVATKATALTNLKTAIETAQGNMTDHTLTDAQLRQAVTILNARISAVDKKIYCSTNACGTDAQLRVSTNQWCYDRSIQSKHWILFWEAGYGNDVPAAVPGILEKADQIFEFYANDLGFITINEGKSKTDTYKMIIRLRYTTTWEASGSGIDDQIGLLTLSNGAHTSRSGQTLAHEIGHCFQYQTHCDNNDQNGWNYNWGASTLNVFWEMCAQWQAYKFYPAMQFVWNNPDGGNDWLGGTLNGLHRHPLCVGLRYNNYFIQDYFCHRHGMDIIGRLWNQSRYPEDPLQAYMRLTMDSSLSAAEKLEQLNNEMWEYGARMTTFDLDPIRTQGAATIGKRNQTNLTEDSEGYWWPTKADCIENFGNNAIRLNAPTRETTVYAELTGEAGASGYNVYKKDRGGWKFGFVALKRDGTRIYGDIATANTSDPTQIATFECPAGCTYLWLVVSGAPTAYWTRDWLSWEVEGDVEQWPYKVRFAQTNVYGQANVANTDIIETVGISDIAATPQADDNNVYSITGQMVRQGSTSLNGLPSGIYIVGGKKVMKR